MSIVSNEVNSEMILTIETGLECSMFTGTSFTVVLVNNEGPWLVACTKTFCHVRDRICWGLIGRVIVIVCNINISSFVVNSL